MTIAKNIEQIKSELKYAKLLVVSKTQSIESIKTCYDLGQRDFGENRVAELKSKANELNNICPEIRWHFIGHLQSKKIKDLLSIEKLFSIHSVDSFSLLEKIVQFNHSYNHTSENQISKAIGLFLEIKTTDESSKSGMTDSDEIEASIKYINDQKNSRFYLQGLMTMAPLEDDQLKSRAEISFKKLKELGILLQNKFSIVQGLELSMGMSQDYMIADNYQSNWVRVGSKVFN